MRPRLSFSRQRARVHCVHPWTQPFGRLSPCKSAVLPICPSTRQICLEQIWTLAERPQGAPQGWGASTTAMLSVAGTRWRDKSARSRFGRPQDACRVCATEGAHLKSCAIIASIGEICGLVYPDCMRGQSPYTRQTGSPQSRPVHCCHSGFDREAGNEVACKEFEDIRRNNIT